MSRGPTTLKDALRFGYGGVLNPLGVQYYAKIIRDEMFFVQETLCFFERLDDLQFNALFKTDFGSQNKIQILSKRKKSLDFEVIF